MLVAGGRTELPRWTLDPAAGVAVHEEPIPAGLQAAADGLGASRPAVWLAVHAAILAAVSGEAEVVAGRLTGSGARPCRVDTGVRSWRELVAAAARVDVDAVAYAGFAVEDLRRELGVTGPEFDTVLDAQGPGRDPEGREVAVLGVVEGAGQASLVVRYRTDVLDADAAARLAGYHVTALQRVASAPDAAPAGQSLVSAQEVAWQVERFAGPVRPLPDVRAHEVFEQVAARWPDRVAAVCRTETLTYAQLNARANRVARALLAGGLRPEDVVAVVTERDLDWLTAMLAVFKAGGVYLPIEPHFPAERIAAVLRRSDCRFVLTQYGATATLEQALTASPAMAVSTVAEAVAQDRGEANPDVEVGADQLAYIYFTSGSTGEPKGAMCEHAGMLNHLLAKIEDLGIDEGSVVAQVAPQCFDISLWQLVSALLVGGRTVIVPQDVVLDADRFLDTLATERVAVAQVVPSYLEVLLSLLARSPQALADLRIVSVTGEAVKKELVQRWFATVEGVPLVNAYGLTETSDDTNHEVLRAVPHHERVPLGPSVRNVRVMIVDEDLVPVPAGAPGLIAFAGVCVGRGYVNDPQRTRDCYRTDPYRPGERLYLGGDYGRWLPEGKLEFLGRRDGQVKVRGFRIELGEVENALLRVAGVRDAAVVVADDGRGARLVGFCAADVPLAGDDVRDEIGRTLPEYMVPSAVHQRDTLPLTANGKIDRKALRVLATELAAVPAAAAAGGHRPPATAAETRLARAWADVLGLDEAQIDRDADFFAIGGTSLSAVKLAVVLGRVVSLPEITRNPVLADLARLLDAKAPG